MSVSAPALAAPALAEWVAARERCDWYGVVPTPAMRRARRHVMEAGCYSSVWKCCPPDYYKRNLEGRREILGTHSTSQLCKACLFENKNYRADSATGADAAADPTNARYYLVVVQYVESINVKRLASELRGLRPAGPTRLDPNYFADLRLAPEDVAARLTGYGHNGVSPFGMLDQTIPVVVCKGVLGASPRFVWMGGGEPNWKLGMAAADLVRGVGAIVLDVSEPRSE